MNGHESPIPHPDFFFQERSEGNAVSIQCQEVTTPCQGCECQKWMVEKKGF